MTGWRLTHWGIAALVAFPGLAFAAETAEDHMGEPGGGMPQLELSTFPTQIFWLIVVFSALYWLLSKKVIPQIEGVMEQRENRMQQDLDEATRLRTEAEDAYARFETLIADAKAKAGDTVAQTKHSLEQSHAEGERTLDGELSTKIDEAVAAITASANEAKKSIDDVAVEVAQAAVQQLIGVKVNKTETRAALAAVHKEAA